MLFRSIRFYLNGLAVAEDAFIEPANFTALADQSKLFEPGDRIAMFLDCSKSEDATALMGCRIDDGFCQTLGVWSRPRGPRGEGFLVDRDEVDHRVQECLETYKVVWFGVDPSPAKDDSTEASYWKPLIDQWHLQLRRKLKVWATPGAKGHAVMLICVCLPLVGMSATACLVPRLRFCRSLSTCRGWMGISVTMAILSLLSI